MSIEVPGPTWMSSEDWAGRVVDYRRQGRSPADITDVARHLQERGPRQPRNLRDRPVPRDNRGRVVGGGKGGMVDSADYVPATDERRHLVRDSTGLPLLKFVDAGDRFEVWSPAEGGALINPKGPGLRSFGLVQSICRGDKYYEVAYRAADLCKGRQVELRHVPDNPHDRNAVALTAAGTQFGWVQRGRAAAVARRLVAGEDLAGVCLWGPARGRGDNTTRVLIGNRTDLDAMLDGR